MNLKRRTIGAGWVLSVVLLAIGGCAKERGKELVGNWLEDLPLKLNEPDRNRSAITFTKDGWFRTGRWMGVDHRIDRGTVQEMRYVIVEPKEGAKEYAVVGEFAMIPEGERLKVQGPGATVFFRRTESEVPTTRPIGK